MKKSSKHKRFRKRFLKIYWGAYFVFLIIIVLLIILIDKGVFGELPTTADLENPTARLSAATEVISRDGVILGKYFNENRSFVEYDDLSLHLINALLATEDIRFHKHSGIDWIGTLAVPYYLIRGKRKGASTITQQLAKNLFPRKKFGGVFTIVIRKLKEWIIAVRIEKRYTKREIITMYFNTVDFGSNAFGIKSATKLYFNKEPIDLSISEAAILIGILKGTYYYSPRFNPERSKQRRNIVLSQMAKYKFISSFEFDTLSKLATKLNLSIESHNYGLARYFREYLRSFLKIWCKENNYDLYTSGLKIYTTIDSRMQRYAEDAAYQHLKKLQAEFFKRKKGRKNAPFDTRYTNSQIDKIMFQAIIRCERYRHLKRQEMSFEEIQKVFEKPVKMRVFSYYGDIDTVMTPYDSIRYYKYFLNPGIMVMESKTGHIKAWVGGIEYRYFKYDHVNKIAKRQVGSTFKPFVYTTAILNGYSPCLKVPNMRIVFKEYNNWSPRNSPEIYGGMHPLKWGLANSVNCMTAWVIKQVGPEATIQLARKMGIQSHIDPYPSICLGTPSISVFEMTSAFNTYSNKGVWIEPTFITRIEDKNGNILKKFTPREVEVLDEATNYVMIHMLMAVVKEGTARRLRYTYNLTNQIGGKTGTTQNNSDGWFIGFTPQITAACWVGAEDPGVHFNSTKLGQGANMALPIWALFVKKLYADKSINLSKEDFEIPESDLPVEIDCAKFENINDNATETFDDNF